MVLHHENCVMLMTFFRYFFLFWFDYFCLFFSFVENIDWLPLSGRNDNSCSHIGMWPSEIFLIEWCQRVCRSHRNLMTWADHERIYITKLPFDSKEIPKSLHERLTLDVPYYHNWLRAFSTSSWSDEFSSQMCKCETSRILFFIYIFFHQSQVCAGFILESRLKSKLVILDLRGLYWACNVVRGKRDMKEKVIEAQRVFKGYIE